MSSARPVLLPSLFVSMALLAEAPMLRAEGDCVRASNYFEEAGLFSTVSMGPVLLEEPIGENGNANPLNILDCDSDGTLELFITVSPEAAPRSPAKPAELRFRRTCELGGPTVASFVFTQGGLSATWTAFGADGALLDLATSSVSGTKQSVVLSNPAGIARIEIVGIRLCIESICWDCTRLEGDGDGCFEAKAAFTKPGTAAVAFLGDVAVTEATFSTGSPAPLTITNCTGDDSLELFIRWSDNPIAPARFHFPPVCEEGSHPQSVAIRFHQGSVPAVWNAYDASNQLVDSANTLPSSGLQSVAFTHSGGIRRVEVLGMSICVTEVCHRCEVKPRGPLFRRGDADTDGELGIGDAVRTLNWLFLGAASLGCHDAADTDDSGELTMSDAVRTLSFLFLGGPEPPGSEACGPDTTSDELDCEGYRPCAL